MVAPPVAAVDLLYPASHMLRSRRLRLLPPTALHLQTPTLWPSPLHTLLEREYDLGAWLRMGCSSTSSRPRSLVDYMIPARFVTNLRAVWWSAHKLTMGLSPF